MGKDLKVGKYKSEWDPWGSLYFPKENKMRYTIDYTFGAYEGTETVILLKDDDRSPIDVMWARFRRQGKLTLSMAYQSARIVKSEEVEE